MNKPKLFRTKGFAALVENIWDNNPIFIMVLGVCSSLAVTTTLINAAVMGFSVTLVLAISSFLISIVRKWIPEQVRMITFMLIISTFVISVDVVLKIFIPDISKALGPYIGLIITNCNLMGRAEAYAVKNSPGLSFLDSLGTGIGYTMVLLLLSFIRELFNNGSLFGVVIFQNWKSWSLAGIAPGAFFILAVLVIFFNITRSAIQKKKVTKPTP